MKIKCPHCEKISSVKGVQSKTPSDRWGIYCETCNQWKFMLQCPTCRSLIDNLQSSPRHLDLKNGMCKVCGTMAQWKLVGKKKILQCPSCGSSDIYFSSGDSSESFQPVSEEDVKLAEKQTRQSIRKLLED